MLNDRLLSEDIKVRISNENHGVLHWGLLLPPGFPFGQHMFLTDSVFGFSRTLSHLVVSLLTTQLLRRQKKKTCMSPYSRSCYVRFRHKRH